MTQLFGEDGATSAGSDGFLIAFLKNLALILLCGIVGPIFLVAYFLIDEKEYTGWMLWAGAAITFADVVIAYFVTRAQSQSDARLTRMRATGRMVLAEITSLAETRVEVNDRPVVKIGLRISGDDVPAFDAEVRKAVPIVGQAMLHRRILAVLVDPATREFEIDWRATALVTGSVPARFTSTEDGRTSDLTGQSGPLIEVLEVLRRHGVESGGVVDLRAHPAARAEVMAIVRRYGAATATADASSPSGQRASLVKPVAPQRTLTERLAELDALHAAGRIDANEYAQARARVLGEV